MDKEKNKNRTDLLAAGRKKLQQFRQKKDGKGSTKHGKSSTKLVESEQLDADDVAGTFEPTENHLNLGGKVKSPHEESISHSVENLVASETDKAPVGSSSLPVMPEKVLLHEVPPDNSTLTEDGVNSLLMSEEMSSQTVDAESVKISSSETSVTEETPLHAHVLVPVDLTQATSFDALEGVLATAEAMCMDGRAQVTGVGTMQEADYLGSKQFGRSSGMELHGDRGIAMLEHGDSSDAVTGITSGYSGMTELTPEADVFSASAVTLPKDEADDSAAFGDDVRDQQRRDQVADSFKGEAAQAERDDMSTDEGQNLCQGSSVSQADSKEKPVQTITTILCGDLPIPSAVDLSSIGLLQLAEVLRGLDDKDFRFLLKSRESASNAVANHSSLMLSESAYDVSEKFKEQLFLTNIAKDVFYLQLSEQFELQMELERQHHQLVGHVSALSTLHNEVQEKNESLTQELAHSRSEIQTVTGRREELQKLFDSARMEIEALSARSDELQMKLEESEGDMANMSTELADCKDLVADLQVEYESLNKSFALLTQERMKLLEETESLVNENERLLSELAECKGLVASLQLENSNFRDSHSLVTEERKKFEEDVEYSVHENERLSLELLVHAEVLSVEHAHRRQLELDLQEVNSHLTQLIKKTAIPSCTLDIDKSKLREMDTRKMHVLSPDGEVGTQFESSDSASWGHKNVTSSGYSQQISKEQKNKNFSQLLDKLSPDGLYEDLLPKQVKLHIYDDSFGFVALKGHLEEVETMMQKLDTTIEQIHSHSASLSRTGGKVAAPGISKLIQAFESKALLDDFEGQEIHITKDQSAADPFLLAKEQSRNLRTMLMELHLKVENVGKQFKGERECRELASLTFSDLKDQHEVLKNHINNLEARNIELEVLYEALKQHLCHIGSKNNELEALYEIIMQQDSNLKAENSQLGKKLSKYYPRITELQSQLDEIQSSSDEMASMIYCQLENLQKETSDRSLLLEQKWNCNVAQISEAVGRLGAFVEGFSATNILPGTQDGLDIGGTVVASVTAATLVIKSLQEKLEATCTDLELVRCSYREMSEKFSHLHDRNELAIGILHKIQCDLWKLVVDSGGCVEECETSIQDVELRDPLQLSNYENLADKLGYLLGEKMQLELVNSKLNLELINKTKDLEDLNQGCRDLDAIFGLVEDIKGVVELNDKGISNEPPVPHLLSMISNLVQKYKEACEEVQLSREEFGSKVIESIVMEAKIHELYSSYLRHENEIPILKENLSQAEYALVLAHSELQQKVTELEQSEQKLSSVKEKLSIAVAKGKGLIVQRDSLRQSLAEASSALERCSEESKLKDARMHEVESKLKTYSEAGERVEALESELSYIRNSATALRESFLHKDSVLQRVEEILEDLELPEQFHSREIIEKVDWLARSVTRNSLPLTDWDQKSSVEGASYSDGGYVVTDDWKDDVMASSNMLDDMRRKYEELQSKFYGLAEQNEMLEQSLMERNNLVQRWEEVLDRINMCSQFPSMEPEDRIEWLGSAFSEARHMTDLLQQKIDSLETYCGSLTADLDGSRRRESELEVALQGVSHEKEQISGRLENLIHDNERVSERSVHLELENDELQKAMSVLQEKLIEKSGNENRIHIIEGGIRRLQNLIIDALEDPVGDDVNSEGTSVEILEELLRNLIGKFDTLCSTESVPSNAVDEYSPKKADASHVGEISRDTLDAKEQEVVVLKKELEAALGNLMHVTEERDTYMEKYHSLVSEVETLDKKCQNLQQLLNQEEQRSASVKEKLNVAVRKGKLLVQQRDKLKQAVEELTMEVDNLKAETSHQKNALTNYEQAIKDSCTYSESVKALESESQFLKERLAEAEHCLQEKEHTISLVTSALGDINVGNDINITHPLEKLKHLGKLCCNLHAAVASSEHEAGKSRRAAELLLAELNEVQELNDSLQEELAKAAAELSEVSKERELAMAARIEALSHVEQLSTIHSEERKNLFANFWAQKSSLDKLKKGLSNVTDMLADVNFKDLELLRRVEAGIDSCLKSTDAAMLVDEPFVIAPTEIISSNSEDKENLLDTESPDSQILNEFDANDICEYVGNYLQQFTREISALKEKLCGHLISVNEEAKRLSRTMGTLQREMTSQKESVDLMEREITRIKSIGKQEDLENVSMRRNIALLYEACTSSIVDIENRKQQLVGVSTAAEDLTIPNIEEDCAAVANRLLLSVKDFVSMQAEIIDDRKEMKIAISDLQKELHEKDIQKENMYMDFVAQIKEADAAKMRYAMDLQSAETRVREFEKRLDELVEERSTLVQRVGELKVGEGSLLELQHERRLLTETLAAKEQEIEALMQALEEEEVQMEELTKKIEKLEKIDLQKDIDLENLEASHAKTMKKLSITVTKFDELHHLSEDLLAEVEKLQAQLQDRDTEISFLRQEVTRCTNDSLVASQMSSQKNSDEIYGLLMWLDSIMSRVWGCDVNLDGIESVKALEYREMLQKQIACIVSELEDMRVAVKNKDTLLQAEKDRVEELLSRSRSLEIALVEKESQLNLLQDVGDSGRASHVTSEITEVEPVMNKWATPVPSITPQVRSLRKVNNDQVAIAVDIDPDSNSRLEDEDDDKVHGFKSLTTAKIVPKFTRPVADMIDGLWVSCDRALMRQPALRLGIIIYWAVLHTLLAAFVV